MALIVLIVIVAGFGFYVIGLYNGLVRGRNEVKSAWSSIDVQLKRRYDLIPNLVESAKAYLKHEHDTLTEVTKARNVAVAANQQASLNPANADSMKALVGAESALSGTMSRLLVTMEQYPDLKANQTIAQLMEELTSTENKISFARQAYNDSVMSYNTTCEKFPNVLIAKPFGFTEAVLFEIKVEAEREAVKVQF